MAANFLKRKAKSLVPEVTGPDDVHEFVVEYEQPPALDTPEAQNIHVGFDIYSEDGGKNYKVAEIEYDSVTGEAKVIGRYNITRLVALTYLNQKMSLSTLKKKSTN